MELSSREVKGALSEAKRYAADALLGFLVGICIAGFIEAYRCLEIIVEEAVLTNRLALLAIVPLGLLVSKYIVTKLAINKRTGCGTHGFLEAYHMHEGHMPLRDVVVKAFASAVTIGCGGSAGLEGPCLSIGGGTASALMSLRRKILFEEDEREEAPRIFLAGGAAGIAAVFRAPLTGLLFALEIPYKLDIERMVFVDAAIASVVSYFVYASLMGGEALFPHTQPYETIPLYNAVVLGFLAGLVGKVFALTYVVLERRGEEILRKHGALSPLLAGLALATIGLFEPRVLGVGYGAIHEVVEKGESFNTLLFLLVAKIVATCITLCLGGTGGLFIPSIYVGAMLGAAYASVTGGPRVVYVAIGMASVLAASSKSLMTAVAFTAETLGPVSVVPSIIAAAVSYFSSGLTSFYDTQLLRRPGEKLLILRDLYHRVSVRDPNLLKEVKVHDVAVRPRVVFTTGTPVSIAFEKAKKYPYRIFPVIDYNGRFVGFVALEDIVSTASRLREGRVAADGRYPVGLLRMKHPPTFRPFDTLESVILHMLSEGEDKVVVVDEEGRLKGIIAVRDILRFVASKLGAAR